MMHYRVADLLPANSPVIPVKFSDVLVLKYGFWNILLQVGDFGLSRIKRNTLVSGGVRGTLPWMAPELLNGSSSRVSEKVRWTYLNMFSSFEGKKRELFRLKQLSISYFILVGWCFLLWNFAVGNLDWRGTLWRYALWCNNW